MPKIEIKLIAHGLLDYAKEGREAVRAIRKAMYKALNAGRRIARQQIRSQFQVRTGFLRRQAGKMRPKVTIRDYEISGKVTPIPRLMSIFEGGATLAHGRGFLHPRPVVGPGQSAIDQTGQDELQKIMAGIGR
jgi:hypothetical protein